MWAWHRWVTSRSVNRHRSDSSPPTDVRSVAGSSEAAFEMFVARAQRMVRSGSDLSDPWLESLLLVGKESRILGFRSRYERCAHLVSRHLRMHRSSALRNLRFEPIVVGSQNYYAASWRDPSSGQAILFEKVVSSRDREVTFWSAFSEGAFQLSGNWHRIIEPRLILASGNYSRLFFPFVEHERPDFMSSLGQVIRAVAEINSNSFLGGGFRDSLRSKFTDVRRGEKKFVHSVEEYQKVYPSMGPDSIHRARERGKFIKDNWHFVRNAAEQLADTLCHNDAGAPNVVLTRRGGVVSLVDWSGACVAPFGRDLHPILRHRLSLDGYDRFRIEHLVRLYRDACHAMGVPVAYENAYLGALEGFCLRYTGLIPRVRPPRLHVPAQKLALELIAMCGGPGFSRSSGSL